MPDRTAIEWTDATWNPVTGCTKISPGCARCYAEAITLRFGKGGPFLPGKATITLHPDRLGIPGTWKAPRRIFVDSMSDLFHEEVPTEFIQRVFRVMAEAPRHTFQVLTKREKRLESLARVLDWPGNVWMGVSVENQYWADQRVPVLTQVPSSVRFLSVEPLLGPVNLVAYMDALEWVIVGGESGPRARTLNGDWVRRIREDCRMAGIPFFFKQWGGRTSKAGGRSLDGRTHDDLPCRGGPIIIGDTGDPMNRAVGGVSWPLRPPQYGTSNPILVPSMKS